MENIIENLKNNFLFQASLGSKELFHSNLIAWILEQENEKGEYEALKIFLKTINAKVPFNALIKENEVKISREENNIDLIIKWKENEEWNFVFIENKMKSIPTSKQLEDYNEKIKKYVNLELVTNNKFLLTPLSSLLEINNHTEKWKNITYKEQIIKFLNKVKNLNFKNPDIKLIVEKYLDFVNKIILLFEIYIGIDENDFLRKKYNYYSSELDDIRRLRMHDMILKMMHERLGNLIKKRVKDIDLIILTNFTRSTGITDMFYKLPETDFTIGLQIQGDTLKHCIMCNPNKGLNTKNILFSKKLVEKKLWFYDFSKNPPILLDGKGRDKFKNGLQINETTTFCEYENGQFLYLAKSLKEFQTKSINDLVDFIEKEFKHLIINIDEIIKIAKEI